MKLIFFLWLSLAGLIAHGGDYSDEVMGWPEVRLRLSGEDVALTDIFDSGLRVYRRPNGGHRYLMAKHARIAIEDWEGAVYPSIPAEIATIKVRKERLVSGMEFRTPPLTINEARIEMGRWLSHISKSEAELEEFLAAVRRDWLHFDQVIGSSETVKFVGYWKREEDFYGFVRLGKSWQWQAPLFLSLEFQNTGSGVRHADLYEGLIPPPPNYEDVDMSPPKKWGEDNPHVSVTNEYRSPPGTLPPEYKRMDTGPKENAFRAPIVGPTKIPRQESDPTENIYVESGVDAHSKRGDQGMQGHWIAVLTACCCGGFAAIYFRFFRGSRMGSK